MYKLEFGINLPNLEPKLFRRHRFLELKQRCDFLTATVFYCQKIHCIIILDLKFLPSHTKSIYQLINPRQNQLIHVKIAIWLDFGIW